MSYYYDEKDIAATLKRAIAQGASYEDVERLLKARNRKIDAGGAEMAQYKNDELTQQANDYLANRKTKSTVNLDRFKSAREQVAVENLRAAEEQHKRNYEGGIRSVNADAEDTQRALLGAYRHSTLADEELLAAIGLGKGNGMPASGYAESTRMETFLEYQNALANARKQTQKQKDELYARYLDAMDQSRSDYNNKKDTIEADYANKTVEQFNADRTYQLNKSAQERQANQWNQTFDAERADRAADEAKAEKEAVYASALQAFKQTGEITTQAQADILGLPIGTKTVERLGYEAENAFREKTYSREEEWHAQEMALKNRELNIRQSSASATKSSNKEFENAFELFKAVGQVITPQMEQALGIPMGTTYWQYVRQAQENNRAQQRADFDMGIYSNIYGY